MVNIELISASGCRQCEQAEAGLRRMAEDVLGVDNLTWRHLNVLEHLDYVVTLGVVSMPAVVANGEVLFSGLPQAQQFRSVLQRLKAVHGS